MKKDISGNLLRNNKLIFAILCCFFSTSLVAQKIQFFGEAGTGSSFVNSKVNAKYLTIPNKVRPNIYLGFGAKKGFNKNYGIIADLNFFTSCFNYSYQYENDTSLKIVQSEETRLHNLALQARIWYTFPNSNISIEMGMGFQKMRPSVQTLEYELTGYADGAFYYNAKLFEFDKTYSAAFVNVNTVIPFKKEKYALILGATSTVNKPYLLYHGSAFNGQLVEETQVKKNIYSISVKLRRYLFMNKKS